MMLKNNFFNRDTCTVAKGLLGKVIRHHYRGYWLAARIIETEAYYLEEKGSHASLGYTEKRKALFMPPGTIYMYYARGMDSLNISTRGKGNAVLIKSAVPFCDAQSSPESLQIMLKLNPGRSAKLRPTERLCSGQTLLCKSLNIKLDEWDQKNFNQQLYIDDIGYKPAQIIQTKRLGIPEGRDEHLQYRFIDATYASFCTKNPLTEHIKKFIYIK